MSILPLLGDDPEFRRQLVQEAEPGSLAELALTDYDKKATAAEQESVRRTEEQERTREHWASIMEEKVSPRLTTQLATALGVGSDHPAMSGLRWYLDRENLKELHFTTPPGEIRIESGEEKYSNMYADVAEGVFMRASNWGRNDQSPIFSVVHDTKHGSSTGLRTLSDLGSAIAEAAHRRAAQ